MAFQKQAATALQKPRRFGTSPVVLKLREQLQAAQKKTGAMRAQVKEQNSAGATMASAGSVVVGGTLAGGVKGALGDGALGRGVGAGVGVGLTMLGAFVIPGTFGGLVAGAGAGMVAKVAGDFAEDLVGDMFGGGE